METNNKRGPAPNARNGSAMQPRGGSASTQTPALAGGSTVEEIASGTKHEFYQDGTPESRRYPFYMVKDPKNEKLPKKLGEGTFGMVFEARSPVVDHQHYALKVLYDQGTETAQHESELRVALTLNENLDKLDKLDQESRNIVKRYRRDNRLVLPEAYCKGFEDEFWGKSELEKKGTRRFSTNAYIMEKYDCSLKNMVEDSRRPLKDAKQRELECSAVCIIQQLAPGLLMLHAAGLRHEDIKPANIYYRDRGDDIDFKLGDLGSLVPHDKPVYWGTICESSTPAGFGTRHYRSIEQVDYCDCAECKVTVGTKANDPITLVTSDPKFKNTIIDTGDLACFTRLHDRPLFKVQEVRRDSDSNTVTIDIKQRVEDDRLKIENDSQTQVFFYKNASIRTDLFGLAGILYEIVTAGQSPEQFYKLLYSLDNEHTDIDKNVLDRYESWQNRTLDDSQIGAVFQEINRNDYNRLRSVHNHVHKQVVGAVLKCMMSSARGSYYKRFEFQGNEIKAWSKLIQEFAEISRLLGAHRYDQHAVNILTRKSELKGQSSEVISASKILKDICPADGSRDSRHWMWVGNFLDKLLIELSSVNQPEERQRSGSAAGKMVLLAPDLLTLDSDGRRISSSKTVVLENDLSREILAQDPIFTRTRRFATQFEPIWWQYGTCRVELKEQKDTQSTKSTTKSSSEKSKNCSPSDSNQGGGDGGMHSTESSSEQDNCGNAGVSAGRGDEEKLADSSASPKDAGTECIPDAGASGGCLLITRPLEFGFSMTRAEAGDFVLCAGTMVPQLYKVHIGGVDGNAASDRSGALQLEEVRQERQPAESGESRNPKEGYLIKRPMPNEYYAGMFGAYIYQFLVLGSDGIVDFPTRIHAHIRNGSNCSCFGPVPDRQWDRLEKDDWSKLKYYTLQLIMWLSMGGGFGTKPRNWDDISKAVGHWISGIERVSGVQRHRWTFPQRKDVHTKSTDGSPHGFEASISSEEWESTVGDCPRRRWIEWPLALRWRRSHSHGEST